MAKLDIAFVAGIIDARGHIDMNQRHGKPQPRLSVTTQRLGLLRYLADHTGVSVQYDVRGYTKRPCTAHCDVKHVHYRQSPYWRVDSSRALIVLYNIKPYIVSQKTEVAEAVKVGLQSYPAARGDTAKKMEKLGWNLPPIK